MPFESDAQRRWMYANEPAMARRWQEHTPKGKDLPERVNKKKKKKKRSKSAASETELAVDRHAITKGAADMDSLIAQLGREAALAGSGMDKQAGPWDWPGQAARWGKGLLMGTSPSVKSVGEIPVSAADDVMDMGGWGAAAQAGKVTGSPGTKGLVGHVREHPYLAAAGAVGVPGAAYGVHSLANAGAQQGIGEWLSNLPGNAADWFSDPSVPMWKKILAGGGAGLGTMGVGYGGRRTP
jgi:hypothetical protein